MDTIWKIVKAAILFAAILMAFAIVISLTGCPRPMPPPIPPTDADAGGATCETACARMQQLGCPAGRPTPRGAPCIEVCAAAEASGLISWNVACVTSANTCGASDHCTR